jgi:hypothetical protein
MNLYKIEPMNSKHDATSAPLKRQCIKIASYLVSVAEIDISDICERPAKAIFRRFFSKNQKHHTQIEIFVEEKFQMN